MTPRNFGVAHRRPEIERVLHTAGAALADRRADHEVWTLHGYEIAITQEGWTIWDPAEERTVATGRSSVHLERALARPVR